MGCNPADGHSYMRSQRITAEAYDMPRPAESRVSPCRSECFFDTTSTRVIVAAPGSCRDGGQEQGRAAFDRLPGGRVCGGRACKAPGPHTLQRTILLRTGIRPSVSGKEELGPGDFDVPVWVWDSRGSVSAGSATDDGGCMFDLHSLYRVKRYSFCSGIQPH